MKKLLAFAGVLVLVTSILGGSAFSGERTAETVEVQVAPQTLLLSSEQGGEVTVHVTIPYSHVDTSTLTLNGLAVAWTKADCRGELVAKFDEAAVKAIVEPPSATLTLTGMTIDGDEFSGSDTVKVRP